MLDVWATYLAALITGISNMVTAYILGYSPRKTKEEIKRLQKELLDVYSGVYNLKAVEERLEGELGISKTEARKGLNIPKLLETKRVENRIIQLQNKLD